MPSVSHGARAIVFSFGTVGAETYIRLLVLQPEPHRLSSVPASSGVIAVVGSYNYPLPSSPNIGESAQIPVKFGFAPQDLSSLESSWHNNAISAARSRKREPASATPTTSPSGAGTLTCARCTPASAPPPNACASAPPACAA